MATMARVGWACGCVLAAALAVFMDPADAAPPNIVLIISDDQSWPDYGFMGHPLVKTPNLDKLAKASAVFPRGYVPTALCRPSLMTLATGLYAHQHLTTGNDPSHALADPRTEPEAYAKLQEHLISHVDRHATLPRVLRAGGYRSFQSGKWWEGGFGRGGFTQGMTRGFPQQGGRHGDDGLTIGRQGMRPVLDFIDRAVADDQPFFVWYAPFLPHSPHDPPERLLLKYQDQVSSPHVAKYYAMCEWFDETCGDLMRHLDAKGLRERTLVVYVGDNGWIQSPDGPDYAPRSKQSAYEGGTRQPIMFCWPNVIQPGDRSQQLCSSVDIAPTLLSAAGANPAEDLPGHDLMDALRKGEPTPRREVFGEGFAHDIADLEKPEASLLYRWVIEGKWKLLLTYDGQVGRYRSSHPRAERRPQLFDLLADPHEQHNRAGEHPEIVERLAGRLQQWYAVTERKVETVFRDP